MKRKRAATPRRTIETIISESYEEREAPGVVDFFIRGPDLDITAAEEQFLVDAYTDSGLEWEVRKRLKELGRNEPWIETLGRPA